MKKIVHFTHISYLDTAIEHIKIAASTNYELHVFIGLASNSLNSNIVNLNIDINSYPPLVSFESVVEEWKLNYLKPYFENCKSVHFVVYSNKWVLKNLWNTSHKVNQKIDGIMPDFIHLDNMATRQIFQLPFFIRNRKRLVLNVHDPKIHSGEFDFKRYLIRRIVFKLSPNFVVFAEHSKTVLTDIVSKNKHIYQLKFVPSTVYQNFKTKNALLTTPTKISFVGRISKYKGVEIFLEAINKLESKFPNQKFIIAGKPVKNYKLKSEILKNRNNTIVIEKHLSNREMADIIYSSQLVVCPYIDATQSGIVSIAHGLKRPVLVTPVGGLPNYIDEGKNGVITKEVSVKAIVDTISSFLVNNQYEAMSKDFNSLESIKKRTNDYMMVLKSIYDC